MGCMQFTPQQKRALKLETLTSNNEMLAFWEVALYYFVDHWSKKKIQGFLFHNKTFPRKRSCPL